jgi:hypothetical protein
MFDLLDVDIACTLLTSCQDWVQLHLLGAPPPLTGPLHALGHLTCSIALSSKRVPLVVMPARPLPTRRPQ